MPTVVYKRRINKFITIPSFAVTGIEQIGASYVVAKFYYSLTNRVSFPAIFVNPSIYNFVPVLWWKNGDTVIRKKLWHDDRLLLYCDLYDNTILPSYFALEIWNLLNESTILQSSELELDTSILLTPTEQCFTETAQTDTFSYLVGADPAFDLVTYNWNAVEGDYWTVDELGFTTFVDIPSPPSTPEFYDDMEEYAPGMDVITGTRDGGSGWAGPWDNSIIV